MKKIRWTKEEDIYLIKLYESGKTCKEISFLLKNRTVGSVSNRVKKLMLKRKEKYGCMENILNNVYGRLTVVENVYHSKFGNDYWKCICDCQYEYPFDNISYTYATTRQLINGIVESCGCLRIEKSIVSKLKVNKYDLTSNTYGVGWTINTNREFYFDLEDYNKIKDYCWYESYVHDGYTRLSTNYKDENGRKNNIKFHVLIGFKNYDHINRNPFDNRKSNLRQASAQENNFNKSLQKRNKTGVIGVREIIPGKKWEARIGYNKKTITIGRYDNFNDAVKARLKAEKKYFGEFAPQKHLYEQYSISLN